MERVVNSILLLVSGTSLLLRLAFLAAESLFWGLVLCLWEPCPRFPWTFVTTIFFSVRPFSRSPIVKADARELPVLERILPPTPSDGTSWPSPENSFQEPTGPPEVSGGPAACPTSP